jgi:hypothetical protein
MTNVTDSNTRTGLNRVKRRSGLGIGIPLARRRCETHITRTVGGGPTPNEERKVQIDFASLTPVLTAATQSANRPGLHHDSIAIWN